MKVMVWTVIGLICALLLGHPSYANAPQSYYQLMQQLDSKDHKIRSRAYQAVLNSLDNPQGRYTKPLSEFQIKQIYAKLTMSQQRGVQTVIKQNAEKVVRLLKSGFTYSATKELPPGFSLLLERHKRTYLKRALKYTKDPVYSANIIKRIIKETSLANISYLKKLLKQERSKEYAKISHQLVAHLAGGIYRLNPGDRKNKALLIGLAGKDTDTKELIRDMIQAGKSQYEIEQAKQKMLKNNEASYIAVAKLGKHRGKEVDKLLLELAHGSAKTNANMALAVLQAMSQNLKAIDLPVMETLLSGVGFLVELEITESVLSSYKNLLNDSKVKNEDKIKATKLFLKLSNNSPKIILAALSAKILPGMEELAFNHLLPILHELDWDVLKTKTAIEDPSEKLFRYFMDRHSIFKLKFITAFQKFYAGVNIPNGAPATEVEALYQSSVKFFRALKISKQDQKTLVILLSQKYGKPIPAEAPTTGVSKQ